MRKLSIAILGLVLAVSISACKCAVERVAVDEVDRSHVIIATQLLKYVDADPNIAGPNATEDQKKKARADWKGLIDSDKRNIDKLKKAVE